MANFAEATRKKIRFNTARGQLSVEDLWDLPLTSPTGKNVNLNDIAKELFRDLKESQEVNFVDDVKPSTTVTSLKLDIVKEVIEVRKTERDVAIQAEARKARDQKILELIDRKADQALESKSIEELRAMLSEGAR